MNSFVGKRGAPGSAIQLLCEGGESIFISAEEVVGFTGNRHVCVRKLFKVKGSLFIFENSVAHSFIVFAVSSVETWQKYVDV